MSMVSTSWPDLRQNAHSEFTGLWITCDAPMNVEKISLPFPTRRQTFPSVLIVAPCVDHTFFGLTNHIMKIATQLNP